VTDFEVVTAIQVAVAAGRMCPNAADIKYALAACARINKYRISAGLLTF
jgi:hypothetical protein